MLMALMDHCQASACMHWDSLGMLFYQLQCTLLICTWTASDLFTCEEQLTNALTAYYLFLWSFCQASSNMGTKWEQESTAMVTLRNSLTCAGHVVQRSEGRKSVPKGHTLFPACSQKRFGVSLRGFNISPFQDPWPFSRLVDGDMAWSLRNCMEDSAEQRFGQLKAPWHGTPTIAQGLVSANMCHVRQANAAVHSVPPPSTTQPRKFSTAEIAMFGEQAFESACALLVLVRFIILLLYLAAVGQICLLSARGLGAYTFHIHTFLLKQEKI